MLKFSVSVVESCPRLLRDDFESTICVEYEVAGIIHGLLSLVCAASDVPDRLDVKALILSNDGSHVRRLTSFVGTEFCVRLMARFPHSPFSYESFSLENH